MVLLSAEQLEKAKNDSLYVPHLEKDSCGILCDGRKMLQRLTHRGACSCNNDSDDGAGVMIAIPDPLYRKDLRNSEECIELPPVGEYATGLLFLKSDSYEQAIEAFTDLAKGCSLAICDMSDSGCFDNVLGFLVHAGNRSLPEAAMTMVPEAWENDEVILEQIE